MQTSTSVNDYLRDHIRTVPDWPAPGVQFRDITPLLQDPKVFRVMTDAFVHRYMDRDLRPELDLRNEKIGFKVREAQMMKIPYMFVLGDREAAEKTVTIRNRKGDNMGTFPFAEAVAMIRKLNDDKTID